MEFFVAAGESDARTGQFVPRDPIRVPTFGTTPERSHFVWTVAKDHQTNDADRALFARAAHILAAYTERRVRYIVAETGIAVATEDPAHPRTRTDAGL